MNKIIRFSVNNRIIVLLFTALFLMLGWYSFKSLSVDALPDITNVQVSVNTLVEGLAPEETERYITLPIEAAMNGIAGVTHVRSLTKFGLSQVVVNFEDGVDIYRARQQVSERLQSVLSQLPEGAQPQLGPITTGLGEIYFYTIEADEVKTGADRIQQLMELRSTQEWIIKRQLMTVKGVASVDTTGGYEKQFHIQPDISRLTQYGISFEDIEQALHATNRNVGGGYIQQEGKQFLVQSTGLFEKPKDIEEVPIKSLENMKVITIGDVAKVNLSSQLRVGAALVNGHEAVMGMVYLLAGDNSRRVAADVHEKIEEIRKVLPKGIKIETLYNRSELVNSTINTVIHNLSLGALLVVAVLLALVGNLRAALITALMIPLSLFFTFIMMNWRGMSGNLMSLGALDFGIIVDGAVIVLENCVRLIHNKTKDLKRSLTPSELKETVINATIETRKAAGFGELIIVIVFIPIFALTGIEGKMFKPMAATFCFAILGALLFSFTTAPALASIFLKGNIKEKTPWLMRQLEALYKSILDLALRFKTATIMMAVLSILLGGFLFSRLGSEFLPQLNEGSIVLMLNRNVNIGMDASVAMQEQSEKIILENFPEVEKVYSRIGTAEVATDPMGIYLADTFLTFKDSKEWRLIDGKKRSKDELAVAIADLLKEKIPEQDPVITQPIQMRFNELLEGTRADVSLKIYDDDLKNLLEVSQQAEEIIKTIHGAGDVEAEMSETSPILKVRPKHENLKKYGLSSAVVLEAISTSIGGKDVGFFYEGVRRFPILIRLDENQRANLEVIRNLPIKVGQNFLIKLSELADIDFVEGFGTILRENTKRRAAILINPRGRDTKGFVDEAKKVLDEKIKLPEGSFFQWGGNFKNLEQARDRLMLLTPLVLILVFMMIFVVFKNLLETFLIFSGIPLALVGGVLGLQLNDLPFSISAGIGFIALSGIALLNGVVLISYFNQLKQEGMFGEALIKKGALIRLRPVLMTALVEVFGFLPMMLSHDVGAEVQKPLATVVIGGVISSTLLTLVVLPTVYNWIIERHPVKKA